MPRVTAYLPGLDLHNIFRVLQLQNVIAACYQAGILLKMYFNSSWSPGWETYFM